MLLLCGRDGIYLFGGVLLLGSVGASQLVLYAVSVLQLFNLINPDQPVLGRESLLQVLQLYVLVADLSVACSVKARWRPEVQLNREIKLLKSASDGSNVIQMMFSVFHFCLFSDDQSVRMDWS